ncbi:MAG TPA: PAS domain S-box protein [Bacteroidales bacterium]|nr:PAS domain S-box protein [Bacteroidales bacterium]
MISFDMRTVIFSFILINIVSSLVLVFLWLHSRNRYQGIGRLVFAFASQMVAYLLIILRGKLPVWISMDAGNAISLIGIIIGYTGLQEYTGKKISYLSGSVIFFVAALLHFWFRYVNPEPTARYLIISGAYLFLFSGCAHLLIFRVSRSFSVLTRLTGFVFAGLALVAAIKMVDFFVSGSKPVDYFESGSFEAIMMIAYQMLIIMLTISITMMVSHHLLKDIQSEEEKFSTIFLTAPNAIILSEFPDGKIIDVNNHFFEITGCSQDDLKGKSIFEILKWKNEKDKTIVKESLVVSGTVTKKEFHFYKKTGDLYTGMFSATVISIAGGKRLLTTLYDITEKKQLQDLIRIERNFMRALLDNLPDAVYVTDAEGQILLSNSAHTKVLGAEDESAVAGRALRDFFTDEEAEMFEHDIKIVLKEGKRIIDKTEFIRHPENGFPCWQLTSRIPLCDDDGKPFRVLNISHDITEKKRAEDNLRETDKFNRSLLKTIPFGMDVVDENGSILFMGEKFRKIFGNDAVGKKCWELYRDDRKQCVDCPLHKGIMNDNTEVFESHGLLGNKVFEISHTGMLYHGKKAMLEVFHDITERKRNEGELIKSKERAEENDRIKSAFLHNISHEIRTPMNAIVGFTNLLNDPNISTEDHRTYTDIISRSSNHLLSIINDVIEISSVEAGMIKIEESEFKIHELINKLIHEFSGPASEKGLVIDMSLPENDSERTIIADQPKLNQVLVNLLDNAIKFTSQGKITFGYSVKDQFLEFFVTDTGIGIDPSLQPKVFDRFFQVDNSVTRLHEGTGIGLSICKAYVELMGGKIWLKSVPSRGSVFCFTIPLKRA